MAPESLQTIAPASNESGKSGTHRHRRRNCTQVGSFRRDTRAGLIRAPVTCSFYIFFLRSCVCVRLRPFLRRVSFSLRQTGRHAHPEAYEERLDSVPFVPRNPQKSPGSLVAGTPTTEGREARMQAYTRTGCLVLIHSGVRLPGKTDWKIAFLRCCGIIRKV